MISTFKKHQKKKQLGQLHEILNDFIIGTNTNAVATENKTLEPQTNAVVDSSGNFAVGKPSASEDEVAEKKILPTKFEKRLIMLLCLSKVEYVTRF